MITQDSGNLPARRREGLKREKGRKLRSREWFDTPELYGWTRQAALQGLGLDPGVYRDRPLIGICNTWSELTHCNAHLRALAQRVKEGVWQAGGVPFEFRSSRWASSTCAPPPCSSETS